MDSDSSPVSVSSTGDSRRNVIVWMDHRAVDQAERINKSNSPVLEYCGGGVSPEMQPPKVPSELVPLFHFWLSTVNGMICKSVNCYIYKKIGHELIIYIG